jgi:1-acyl-sn-glycerol-3-phosphate acyltransferase
MLKKLRVVFLSFYILTATCSRMLITTSGFVHHSSNRCIKLLQEQSSHHHHHHHHAGWRKGTQGVGIVGGVHVEDSSSDALFHYRRGVATCGRVTSTHLSMSSSSTDTSNSNSNRNISSSSSRDSSSSEQEGPAIGYSNSCLLSPSQIQPILTLKKGTPGEKIINAFGLYTILVTFLLNPLWALAMFLVDGVYKIFPDIDPNRAIYDSTGKIWSKVWLTLTNSYPSMSGRTVEDVLKSLKNGDEKEKEEEKHKQTACLFVANHASWLDIPVLCTVLDPVFKFIAKGELLNVPCIGQQLTGVSTTVLRPD